MGDTIWCANYDYRTFRNISPTPDNGFIGATNTDIGDYYSIVTKADSMGNVQWAKKYTFSEYNQTYMSVYPIANNEYCLISAAAGISNSSVLHLDSVGNVLSCVKAASTTRFVNIQKYGSKMLVSGFRYIGGVQTQLLICMDANGNVDWVKSSNSTGSLYELPRLTNSGIVTLARDSNVLHIAKLDFNGENGCDLVDDTISFVPASTIVSTVTVPRLSVPLSMFTDSITRFNSLPTSYTNCAVALSTAEIKSPVYNILPHPNPFIEKTIFCLNDFIPGTRFLLYNLMGQQISDKLVTGKTFELNRGQLKTGIYLFRFACNGSTISIGKLVVD